MSIIQNHLQVEITIDQILYRLRLLRLNELQQHKLLITTRPTLETAKSTSHIKTTEMTDDIRVQSTTSTPMFVALTQLAMTKPESL